MRKFIAVTAITLILAACGGGSSDPQPSEHLNNVLCGRSDGLLPPGKDCD
jgi:hypothetical protein